jgi:hypothetical protein
MFQGCFTTIGTITGLIQDENNPDYLTASAIKADTIKPGKVVTAQLLDGASFSGKFLGLGTVDSAGYAMRYEKVRMDIMDSLDLPSLRDTLIMLSQFTDSKTRVTYGGKFTGIFQGFDLGRIIIHEVSLNRKILMIMEETTQMRDVKGKSYDPFAIRSMLISGNIPFRSTFDIQLDNRVEIIPLEEIHLITSKNRNYLRNGIMGGAIADVLIVTILEVGVNCFGWQLIDIDMDLYGY